MMRLVSSKGVNGTRASARARQVAPRSQDEPLQSPWFLRLDQLYCYLVGERGRAAGGEGDLLDMQIVDLFGVTIEVGCDGSTIEGIGELENGAGGVEIAGTQGITILLPRNAGWGAVVLDQVVQAKDDHAPDALAGSQIDVGFAPVGAHGGFTHARLLHLVGAGFDEVAGAVEDDFTVLTNGGHGFRPPYRDHRRQREAGCREYAMSASGCRSGHGC